MKESCAYVVLFARLNLRETAELFRLQLALLDHNTIGLVVLYCTSVALDPGCQVMRHVHPPAVALRFYGMQPSLRLPSFANMACMRLKPKETFCGQHERPTTLQSTSLFLFLRAQREVSLETTLLLSLCLSFHHEKTSWR